MEKVRKVIITCFTEFFNQEKASQLISQYNIKSYVIGGLEYTEKEKEHFHVYIHFDSQKRFNALINEWKPCHIEGCKGDELANYNYCTKNGIYESNIDINLLINDEKSSLAIAVVDDLSKDMHIWELVRKYPKFAVYNIKNLIELKRLYDDYKGYISNIKRYNSNNVDKM